MADKFFASKSASEKTTEAAMTAMAADVRTDLGQVAAAHSSLYRQLQDQSAQIAEVATDARRARVAIEGHVDRTAALEKLLTSVAIWVKSGVALLIVVIALLVTLLLRTR